MVDLKISDENLGRIRTFLDQKWSALSTVKLLSKEGLNISTMQIHHIKKNQQRKTDSIRSTQKPGPKTVLSERSWLKWPQKKTLQRKKPWL